MITRLWSTVGGMLTTSVLIIWLSMALVFPFFVTGASGLKVQGELHHYGFLLLWALSFLVLNLTALALFVRGRSAEDFEHFTSGNGFDFVLSGRDFYFVIARGLPYIASSLHYSRMTRLWARATWLVAIAQILALMAILAVLVVTASA
jgi:hypothetical protein